MTARRLSSHTFKLYLVIGALPRRKVTLGALFKGIQNPRGIGNWGHNAPVHAAGKTSRVRITDQEFFRCFLTKAALLAHSTWDRPGK